MDRITIRLRDGETAIVGFGSLLGRENIGSTIGRVYDGPLVRCHVDGWCRCWDASMPNEAFYYAEGNARVYPDKILYLNARMAPDSAMNCSAFVLTADELRIMRAREWIYREQVVTPSLRGVAVENGAAIMYVAREEHVVKGVVDRREAAVRASYLRVLHNILAARDAAFVSNYWRMTDPLPEGLVVEDFLDPERTNPWEKAGHSYDPRPYVQTEPPRE